MTIGELRKRIDENNIAYHEIVDEYNKLSQLTIGQLRDMLKDTRNTELDRAIKILMDNDSYLYE